MFDSIRNFFTEQLQAAQSSAGATSEAGYRRAAAALLLEMMHADHDVSAAEQTSIRAALGDAFSLDDAALDELVSLAAAERDASVCLYRFTRELNESLDMAQKIHIIELLWQVAYADGNLDRYEEYLARKVADLLYVPHADFINAKLRAADGSENPG